MGDLQAANPLGRGFLIHSARPEADKPKLGWEKRRDSDSALIAKRIENFKSPWRSSLLLYDLV